MAKITVSPIVAEVRELRSADPTGETVVKIRPPGLEEELERGRILTKRSVGFDEAGFPVTNIEYNRVSLWAEEIFLTYQETNLEVELPDGTLITFAPREKIERGVFMNTLLKLPRPIFNEWHAMVISVVRDWGTPF